MKHAREISNQAFLSGGKNNHAMKALSSVRTRSGLAAVLGPQSFSIPEHTG